MLGHYYFGRERDKCESAGSIPSAVSTSIRVFISYAREDTEFVDLLVSALKERSIAAWLDRREIPPAADWLRRIIQGITEATFFIFVVSPHSVVSEICGVELRQAVALNKPLAPIIRHAAPLPESLGADQWSDFTDGQAFLLAVDRLEAALRHDPEWLATHARFECRRCDVGPTRPILVPFAPWPHDRRGRALAR